MNPETPASSRGGMIRRFLLGVVAPFALPALVYLILGTLTKPWMYGVCWIVLLALGLLAGFKHRSWAFFVGALLAILVFSLGPELRHAPWFRLRD